MFGLHTHKKRYEIIYGMQKPTACVPLREPECIKVEKCLNSIFVLFLMFRLSKYDFTRTSPSHNSSIICYRKRKLKKNNNAENNQPTIQHYSTVNLLMTLSWHFTNTIINLLLALEGHKVPARLGCILGSMQIQFSAKKLLKPSNRILYCLAPTCHYLLGSTYITILSFPIE